MATILRTVSQAMNEIISLHYDIVNLSEKSKDSHKFPKLIDSGKSLKELKEEYNELETKITYRLIRFFNNNLGAKKFLVDYITEYKISKNYDQSDMTNKLFSVIEILFGKKYEGLELSLKSTEFINYIHASIIENMNNNYK